MLITFGCQKDDTQISEEEAQTENLKAVFLSSGEIPTHILDFVKTKTNNSLKVSILKNEIQFSNSDDNEFNRETPLGIVQTNKVVQVNNERNTKYTFKVSTPDNANSVINLIVVDMGGDIIEYFIQYIFDPNNPSPLLPSGAIDMSRFTGGMTFYNMEGVIIGNFILTDGNLVDFDGEMDPCPEDEVVEEEEDDTNDTNDSSTGGGNDNSDPNNNTDNDSSDGSIGGNGEIGDPDQDDPCGFEITYQSCECGGSANGHGASECGGCGGSPTTITNTCNGDSVTYYNSRNSNRGIISGTSPCDGNTGVIIDLEALLEIELLIEDDPFALIEIDCDQIQHWQNLAQHVAPEIVQAKIDSLPEGTFNDFEIQSLANAGGTVVNLDYFGVKVDLLPNRPGVFPPERFTPSEFLDYFRRNINDFADGSTFGPYCQNISLPICDQETELWNSTNPLGAIVYINIPIDDGVVVCSRYSESSWNFMTMNAPFAGNHPVSGTRQFGYEINDDGTFNFFVRGVDRFGSNLIENIAYATTGGNPFGGADDLWASFQDKINEYVNNHGGTASVITPTKNRADWDEIQQVLNGEKPISDLGCN
jgi:hypothetical protein